MSGCHKRLTTYLSEITYTPDDSTIFPPKPPQDSIDYFSILNSKKILVLEVYCAVFFNIFMKNIKKRKKKKNFDLL